MITAIEARKQTNKIRETQLNEAKNFANSEWVTCLEPMIHRAIAMGSSSISDFWSKTVLDDYNIPVADFENAIMELGINTLGFDVKTQQKVVDNHIQIWVYISW